MSRLEAALRVDRGAFALDAVLAVGEREVVALLGPNGAGKSTALATLAGLTALDGGRIVLDDVVLDDPARDVFVLPERRPIGTVLQRPSLFPHRTARANVAYGLRTQGVGRAEARDRAGALLADAGLGELADRRPGALSGGQAARIALVRTLARRPSLLLLDEPLAAIDAPYRPELRGRIRAALDGFAGAAVLVTHDVRDAEALADRVVVIEDGRVVQEGPLAALRAAPASDLVALLVA